MSNMRTASNGLNAFTSSMSSFGVVSDEGQALMQKAALALQMMSGAVSMISVATALVEARNKLATAEAVALTAAATAGGPVTWGNIAIATGAAVTASAAIYGLLTIRGDTETSIGRAMIGARLEGV